MSNVPRLNEVFKIREAPESKDMNWSQFETRFPEQAKAFLACITAAGEGAPVKEHWNFTEGSDGYFVAIHSVDAGDEITELWYVPEKQEWFDGNDLPNGLNADELMQDKID